MRIRSIELSWFRGAANQVSLEPNCKSMVVYGANGSGKSSFIDAIECVLCNGRVDHLAHEYSGKSQKKALPNTHRPANTKTELIFRFCDAPDVRAEITDEGCSVTEGSTGVWDYGRTALRQEDVVAFINERKGEKYSSLLPLFGLQPMEFAAENLRQSVRNVESLSQIENRKQGQSRVRDKRNRKFGSDSDEDILNRIRKLQDKYCFEKTMGGTDLRQCMVLATTLEKRIEQSSADTKRYQFLRAAAEVDLRRPIEAIREATSTLAGSVEPLISEKLAVLQPAEAFATRLDGDQNIQCPACGQVIEASAFRNHVSAEFERLQGIRKIFNARNTAMANLSDAVKALKVNITRPEIKTWREEPARGLLQKCFLLLGSMDAEALRKVCGEGQLREIEENLLPIVAAASTASVEAPPEAKELVDDKVEVDIAKAVLAAKEEAAEIARIEILITALRSLEQVTREEIRRKSNAVIGGISDDIKRMWLILHPNEAIEDVRLYVPNDTDKAIDIGLRFYGKEQDSPRLTLSEGYRNSLGLCIFLSIAKREAQSDHPVILDDVVISLDRDHRGMIVGLLEKEFSGRQAIILTHDLDWFAELRQQLNSSDWIFKTLLPFETPDIGIRWSHKTATFDDARAHLKDRPDLAASDTRKIMDVELPFIVERLHMRLLFQRFERNERRTAHEFLERMICDGKKCFEKKAATGYMIYQDAIDAMKEADRFLISWANRSSHTFDSVPCEATKLIEACEKVLGVFKCDLCARQVWYADADGSEIIQCQCGHIRWQYGKG